MSEQIWTPESGTLSEGSEFPGLTQATFRDERGPGVYHFAVEVQGGKVAVLEMDDPLHGEYEARKKALEAATQSLIAVETEARSLEKSKKNIEANRLRKGADADSRAALAQERSMEKFVVENCIVGWNFKRPFSIVAYRQLRGADQLKVIAAIVDASGIGRDAGFLADPS